MRLALSVAALLVLNAPVASRYTAAVAASTEPAGSDPMPNRGCRLNGKRLAKPNTGHGTPTTAPSCAGAHRSRSGARLSFATALG